MNVQITTCQAVNTHAVTEAVAQYLTQQLDLNARFIIEPFWKDRLDQVLAGQIQIGWICGYPYVQMMNQPDPTHELLVMPVMAGARYQNQPIYFSDVVVRRDSAFRTFEELRGASWSYNEVGSQSGYHITRYKLAQIGQNGDFFGRVVASGGHLRSLEMILAGEIDSSALDSTVLEMALRDDPALADKIRIIDTLGPSPIPPWVIHKSVPEPLREAIRRVLTQMHLHPAGQKILALGEMSRFETAVDAHYNSLRQMLNTAQHIHL